MKIYKLSFCDTTYVEYTEEQFNKLEDVLIELKAGSRVQGKTCYLRADNLKHEMIMYVPVENFEVLDVKIKSNF